MLWNMSIFSMLKKWHSVYNGKHLIFIAIEQHKAAAVVICWVISFKGYFLRLKPSNPCEWNYRKYFVETNRLFGLYKQSKFSPSSTAFPYDLLVSKAFCSSKIMRLCVLLLWFAIRLLVCLKFDCMFVCVCPFVSVCVCFHFICLFVDLILFDRNFRLPFNFNANNHSMLLQPLRKCYSSSHYHIDLFTFN